MSSSSLSTLLPFFLLLTLVSFLIGVNGKSESTSGLDYASAFVTEKKSDVNSTNDSSRGVVGFGVTDDDEEGDDGNEDGDKDDEDEKEDEEDDEEEDASGDGDTEEAEVGEEEYEGEERDEYEDELKALAESHEAMSKDETKDEGKSSNVTSTVSSSSKSDFSDGRNFESQENVLEKQSDEDVASNEAIIDEIPRKHEDKEVEELLKFKKEKSLRRLEEEEEGGRKKKKRVPTVKKELSTQKEIIFAGNETQVPKSLVPSEETFNVLNEETEQVQRRKLVENEHSQDKRTQEKIPEKPVEGERILDKRHKAGSWNSKPCKTKECEIKQEKVGKMMEAKDREENDLKSSSKFQKRFGHDGYEPWEGSLIYGHYPIDPKMDLEEQNYDIHSARQIPMDDTQRETKKPKKKKKKKKKKKPQHRRITTTTMTTELPTTKPTTEADVETTTDVQWHLLAEKWFGPSWQQDAQPAPENVAKIHYTATSKPRTVPPSIERSNDRQDGDNEEKEAKTERPSMLLQKTRNLEGPSNVFPYAKNHRYDMETERIGDYEAPERPFQRLRFGEMAATSPRDYAMREKNQEDYRDVGSPLMEEFAHNREYRPPSQDFAMSRNWPDVPPKYNRPWKGDGRSRLSNDWGWRQPPMPPPRYDIDFWPSRGKAWQPMRNYWMPLDNEDMDESEIDRNWRESQQRWQRQRQRQRQRLRQRLRQENDGEGERMPYSPWDFDGSDVWPMAPKPYQVEPPWPRYKDHIYDPSKPVTAASSTTLSRLTGKSKVSLPKISMTTWNSLTSDPATWPYKSSGTKPWPKDENGNSYNPNADLVRKLGLDKSDDGIWAKEKTDKTYNVASDRRNPLETNNSNSSRKIEEPPGEKYKLPKARPDVLYDLRSQGAKEWPQARNREIIPLLESPNEEMNSWYRDEDPRKAWSAKDALTGNLPELRTVGGWVIPPDKSTWMPYRYDPLNPYENVNEIDSWSRRPMNADVWDKKDGRSRMDSNLANPWSKRFGNDPWNKENYVPWDRKYSFDRGQPEDVNMVKPNPPAQSTSESSKMSESNVVMDNSKPESNLSSTKSNNWNGSYDRSSSWPSRWKQFSYHRVTALPTSKPGTLPNSPAKSKNAFVAVSVVSSAKYLGNDIVEDSQNIRSDPLERQLENLRQQNYWSSKTNAMEESIRSTSPTIDPTMKIEPTLTTIENSTYEGHRPEEELPKSATKEYEMNLRI